MKRTTTALASCALLALLLAATTTTAQVTIPVTLEEDHIALEATDAPAPAVEAPALEAKPVALAEATTEPVEATDEDEWTSGDTAKYLVAPFLEPVAYLLTGLVGVFLLFLTLLIKKRFGVEIDEKHLAMAGELADYAIHLVEERAREALKTGGKAPSSVEKSRQAVDFAVGMAKSMGLSDKLIAYLEDLVKSRVGKGRPLDGEPLKVVGVLEGEV